MTKGAAWIRTGSSDTLGGRSKAAIRGEVFASMSDIAPGRKDYSASRENRTIAFRKSASICFEVCDSDA
jgi:hypothetical protein